MKLKPKSTVKNPKALVYKRFTEIDVSSNKNGFYHTTADDKYWKFDIESKSFIETEPEADSVSVISPMTTVAATMLKYLTNYYAYLLVNDEYKWVELNEGAVPVSYTFTADSAGYGQQDINVAPTVFANTKLDMYVKKAYGGNEFDVKNNSSSPVTISYAENDEEYDIVTLDVGESQTIAITKFGVSTPYYVYYTPVYQLSLMFSGTYQGIIYTNHTLAYNNGKILPPNSTGSDARWIFQQGDGGRLVVFAQDGDKDKVIVESFIDNERKRYYVQAVFAPNETVTKEGSYYAEIQTANKIRFAYDIWPRNSSADIAITWYAKPSNILSAKFNNIAKYQTNKYYYVGSFDYMIKGSIEGTTAQYIKGNIIPLKSLNIKYSDDIELSPDDLVVIENRLYSVENPETVLKQQPKPYKIYFATLNNIL